MFTWSPRDTLVTQVLRFAVVEGSWVVRFPVALCQIGEPYSAVNPPHRFMSVRSQSSGVWQEAAPRWKDEHGTDVQHQRPFFAPM